MGLPRRSIGRVVGAGRRVAHSPEWPLVVAILLAALAVFEVSALTSSGPAVDFGREPPVPPRPDFPDADPTPVTSLLLALMGTLPIALIRPYQLRAAAVVTAATALTFVNGDQPTIAVFAAQTIVGYVVARHHARRIWLLVLAPLALYVVATIGDPTEPDAPVALFLLVATAMAAVAGATLRARGAESHRRATEQLLAGSVTELAARGERARIARELHDVVAHHISMISVQAETARLTTRDLPAEGERRLAAIGATAREALTEMRRLLGVLREDLDTPPARAPQPGLAQLNDLLDEARSSSGGASTRLIVSGPVGPLEPGIELTVYRIVQEALTNARRHAPGAATDVELDYQPGRLSVRIRDNGPGWSGESPLEEGHGLRGMRERAGLVGGTLRAGPTARGGFVVDVALPVDRRES